MEQNHWQMVLVFLSFLVVLTEAQTTPTTQELYVKPTEYTPCPEPCHTLDQYMQNATRYFVSNTVFKFLPGMHPMRQALSVSNISNLSLVTTSGRANIICQSYPELSFSEIYNLKLQDLTFSSCTSLVVYDVFDLNLLRISVKRLSSVPTGPFLTAINVLGTSVIEDVTDLLLNHSNSQEQDIFIQFIDTPNHSSVPRHHLTLKSNVLRCSVQQRCWGLFYLGFFQSRYGVDVVFDNLTFINTDVSVFIDIQSDSRNNVSIINSHFTSSGSISVVDKPYFSSKARKLVTSTSQVSIANCDFENSTGLNFYLTTTELSITNCILKQMVVPQKSIIPPSAWLQRSSRSSFHEYSDVAYQMGDAITIIGASKHVLIENVTFAATLSNSTSAATLSHTRFADTLSLTMAFINNAINVHFKNCKFSWNYRVSTLTTPPAVVVSLTRSHNISFSNCEFTSNGGTAVAAYDSTFVFRGTNSFTNNSAYEGGALGFYGNSLVQLEKDTKVSFLNNSAENVGGAIVVVNYFIPTACECFFRLPYVQAHHELNCTQYRMETNFSFSFVNNTARNGGNDIYGASLDCCAANVFLGGCSDIISDIFNLSSRDISAVTSHPLRVCLCHNGQPDCGEIFTNLSCYPGQSFHIPAVIVGDTFGTVDGSAFALVLPQNSNSDGHSLGELQESQQLHHQQCSNLTYSVFSNTREATLVLSANSKSVKSYPTESDLKAIYQAITDYHYGLITPILRTAPLFINVTLLPCPLGFVLSEESHGCACDPQLDENDIPCNLTTQTVQRSSTVWVNASFKDGSANGVIVNKHCPHYYCKREVVDVDLEYPDSQCAFHRSGILCGGCQSGLSLTLGSAQCLPCSNRFLALLIPFAVAGFALVFFLKVLNLTVAVGTINGLIFYANIVRANQDEWLPAEHNILTVFIAWLNLDLGIETCFFDGLDSYWKTWLQFIFPLYVWAIMAMLIIITHFYSIATKLFGGNSVPVIATLFLLSYTKLLCTVTSMLQFSTLEHPEGTTANVWTYDGNVPYLGPKHIPMFIIAFLLLLLLGGPYTMFLLFAQCIQRIDNQRLGRVLIKLKPLLDAYFGPFQDKHRYWVGLLLLVRCALITVISATPTNQSSVTLVIIVVAVCSLIMYPYVGRVYKWNCLNLLENSLFLNLGVLALGTLYIQASGGNQAALAYTCVGVAFTQFVTIVLFHTATAIKSTGILQLLVQKKALDQREGNITEENKQLNEPQVNQQEGMGISYSGELREPLLSYFGNN